MKLTIHCSLCSEDTTHEIALPEGWVHGCAGYGIDDEGSGFCPKHAPIQAFESDQCAGCVGGWGDCDLWRCFAHSEMKLSSEDFTSIRSGICPKRTNGTFGISGSVFEEINLSERATSGAGNALADAIIEYAETYHRK